MASEGDDNNHDDDEVEEEEGGEEEAKAADGAEDEEITDLSNRCVDRCLLNCDGDYDDGIDCCQ
jgi:hypothetical protein